MKTTTLMAMLVSSGAIDGCGGDGDGSLGKSECELAVKVNGAMEWSSSSTPACTIPFGGDSGIWMHFLPLDDQVSSFVVDVADVMEGEIGMFAAEVEVRAEDDRVWTAVDCLVEIDYHTFESADDFASHYLTGGTGRCTEPALATGGGAQGTLSVEPFNFRFPAAW